MAWPNQAGTNCSAPYLGAHGKTLAMICIQFRFAEGFGSFKLSVKQLISANDSLPRLQLKWQSSHYSGMPDETWQRMHLICLLQRQPTRVVQIHIF